MSQSKEAIFKDVETSLRTLETDYVDVIQLHSLIRKDRAFMPETREALVKLKEQGKVRFFGVSTHANQVEVLNALVDDRDQFFDMALVGHNFKSSMDLKEAIAKAAQAKIGIIAMKTQAGGYATDALGPISPHQAALKWVLQNRNITAAIPSMQDMAELRENLAVMGLKYGTVDRLILKSYGVAIRPFYCHLCGKCEAACPKGVQISTINRCLMYAEGYENIELARSTYNEIPANVSAAACFDCAVCVARCINGLDIPEKMKRARRLMA
jgi:predicted aldo/keto reductase-like oxidoreductase